MMDSVPPCPRSSNTGIGLERYHWVCARPALSDRQIPLKNSARQCSSYFQIACAKNTCETALLEIGKTWGLQLCSATPRRGARCRCARPVTDTPPARSRLDSEARPRVALVRVATAARAQVRPRRLTGRHRGHQGVRREKEGHAGLAERVGRPVHRREPP